MKKAVLIVCAVFVAAVAVVVAFSSTLGAEAAALAGIGIIAGASTASLAVLIMIFKRLNDNHKG